MRESALQNLPSKLSRKRTLNKLLGVMLLAADVLVCDVSGVALEYLLLDRPVVYLACPDFFRSAGAPPDGGTSLLVNVGRPAGVEVGYMADLAKAVREALEHPERRSAERQAIARQLVYNPGHATQAAADALESLLAERRNVQAKNRK